MEELIKLIWDFRGSDAALTSIHHAKHLKTYALENKLDATKVETDEINELHSTASMIVPRTKLIGVRDALRPHRGEIA